LFAMLGDGFLHAAVCSTRVTGYWLPLLYKYIIVSILYWLENTKSWTLLEGSIWIDISLQGFRDGFPMVLGCCIDSAGLMVLGNRLCEMTMGLVCKIMIQFQQSRAVTRSPVTLYSGDRAFELPGKENWNIGP
jgi:hypothetical protein